MRAFVIFWALGFAAALEPGDATCDGEGDCRAVRADSLLQLGKKETHRRFGHADPDNDGVDDFNQWLQTHEDTENDGDSGVTGSMVQVSGSYGPILVVYVTYQNESPHYTLASVQNKFWGTPGFNDSMYHNSYHTAWMEASNVDFFEMESTVDVDSFGGSLYSFANSVRNNAAFAAQYATRPYTNVMMIGTGSGFAATAFLPTTQWYNGWSQYFGTAITWSTFAHEVGHNWGLHHAGAYLRNGGFQEYQDDAMMGFQRSYRMTDFNAIARYRLGWLTGAETVDFVRGSQSTVVDLSPLNDGPSGPDFLMMKLPCDECRGQSNSAAGAGAVYLSLRVSDTPSIYGIADGTGCYDRDTQNELTMEDRVHVHFQPNVNSITELWTTLAANESYVVPKARTYIHVCSIDLTTPGSYFARVSVSDRNRNSAERACNAAPTTTTTTTTAAPTMETVFDGCPRANQNEPGIQVSSSTTALASVPAGAKYTELAVACCQGSTCQVKDMNSQCFAKGVNYTTAVNMCQSLGSGWGLCTTANLQARDCCAQRCAVNNHYVWTSAR